MSRILRQAAPVFAFIFASSATAWVFSQWSAGSHPDSTSSFGQLTRSPASLSNENQTSPSREPAQLEFHPREGRRYIYSFERKITIQGLPRATATNSEIAYHGQFELDVLKSHSQGFEALVRAYLTEHPVQHPVSLRIQMSANGEKLEIFGTSLNTDEERQQSAILKDLLAQWDFTLRQDTVGAFEARFESEPLRKTKIAYIAAKDAIAPLPEILSSEHVLGWDESRALPHEISGHETTQMGKGTAALSSQSEYQILLIQEELLSVESTRVASSLIDSDTLTLATQEQKGALDSACPDWSTLLSSLQELDRLAPAAQLKVFGDLLKYTKAHPSAASDLLDLLRSQNVIQAGLNSALFKTVAGALAAAGTPEAQAAVLKIYSDPACPVTGKGAILSALTTTQAPLTASTQDFLSNAMKSESNPDLAQAASYALGASLQKTAEESHKSDVIDAIRQAWTQSESVGDRLALLDAMGNSGQPAYLPELRSVIDTRNWANAEEGSALRAKAVFALRFIRTSDAAQILAQALTEPDLRVRQAAVQAVAMASWNEIFRKPLQSCATSDSVASLQANCRSVLEAADRTVASR